MMTTKAAADWTVWSTAAAKEERQQEAAAASVVPAALRSEREGEESGACVCVGPKSSRVWRRRESREQNRTESK